jgi:hypothetical protein
VPRFEPGTSLEENNPSSVLSLPMHKKFRKMWMPSLRKIFTARQRYREIMARGMGICFPSKENFSDALSKI